MNTPHVPNSVYCVVTMESTAIKSLFMICSAGLFCCVYGENSGKDNTFGLILRELVKQQIEFDKQRAEIGKLRADAETQKSEMEKTMDYQKSEITRLAAELDKQKLIVQKLQDAPASTRDVGSSYIRWGRTSCNGDAITAVYTGYAAGPHHLRGGGGSNLLCIHMNPQLYGRLFNGAKAVIGVIYGVETDFFSYHKLFSSTNNRGASLDNKPGACAQCYIPTRNTIITIPARTSCPVGWNIEYRGHIVSEANVNGRGRNSYVCWDEAPETLAGGYEQNQAVVYPVEIKCGSLPCSKYTDGNELACVVCSK